MKSHQTINPHRIRKIEGGFGFIEHRFLQDGFFHRQSHQSLVLYVFLVLVADRRGVSYYSYDKICSLTKMSLDDYVDARNFLVDQDLIALNGTSFQVLSLPNALGKINDMGSTSCPERSRKTEALSHFFSQIRRNSHD